MSRSDNVNDKSKLEVKHNQQKKGLEIRFKEEPGKDIINRLKAIGFKLSRRQKMWYAVDDEETRNYISKLQTAIDSEQSLPLPAIIPTHEPTKENLEKKNFSYINIHVSGDDGELQWDKYVLFEPSKPIAEGIIGLFAKAKYSDRVKGVYVYPRTYIREARVLFDEGKIIQGINSQSVKSSVEAVPKEEPKSKKASKTPQKNQSTSVKKASTNPLDAALWELNKDRPANSWYLLGEYYHQAKLRDILLDATTNLPSDEQQSIVKDLSEQFKERRPFEEGYVKTGLKGDKAKKQSIRSYVDDIILDNDILPEKPKGVIYYLVQRLFPSLFTVADEDLYEGSIGEVVFNPLVMARVTQDDKLLRSNFTKKFPGHTKDLDGHTFTEEQAEYLRVLFNSEVISFSTAELNYLLYYDKFESLGYKITDEVSSEDETKPSKKITQHSLNQEIELFIDQKEKEGGHYSLEDQIYLSQYSGSGGLIKQGASGKGILYEYYTPDEIVRRMWGLANKYGYGGGSVLEPAVGIGHFLRYAPSDSLVVGFEINPYSKKIAEIFYPNATIYNKSFESIFFNGNVHLKDDFPDDRYELVIGNPPYGDFTGKYAGMGEKKWTGAKEYDHYFITRGLDLLEPDGLLVFIIPSAFLSNDSKYNPIKERIAAKSDLIDAYRLPNRIFKTTDIGTDIVVFKRK